MKQYKELVLNMQKKNEDKLEDVVDQLIAALIPEEERKPKDTKDEE